MGCNCKKKQKQKLHEGPTTTISGNPGTKQRAGSYISAGAWKEGGVFSKDGREPSTGKLPPEVDITGGEVGTFAPAVAQPPRTPKPNGHRGPKPNGDDYVPKPNGDDYVPTRNGHDYSDDEPIKGDKDWRSPPCCEKCDDGKWRRCQGGTKTPPPCTYATISDCQLANLKGQSNIKPLKLSNIYESTKKQENLLTEINRIMELNNLI